MQDPRKVSGDVDRTFSPTRRTEPGRATSRDVSIYDPCRPSRDKSLIATQIDGDVGIGLGTSPGENALAVSAQFG